MMTRIPILSPWFEIRCYNIQTRESEAIMFTTKESQRDEVIRNVTRRFPHRLTFSQRLTFEQARIRGLQ